ncbi:amidohydrolase [Calderihabitans maritimus]|uniref:5-methylthioadenosine/S-adenosylhomocysteine deaminase n=1 Tax=Calderihabitans maritimus TaxID=1246530 RepID=A0A1Z5HND5_9FIRM|nr:amidohydrolase [Calderihabitans maritimus]GAW91042.1 5-methylthioadenosine/S-adenosylhomocysteine deaminase [Calderihabitans maritimus]
MNRILIQDGLIIPMDKSLADGGELHYTGDVAVEQGKIVAAGPEGTIPADWKPDKIIDARGKAVLPGFINCHTHAAMTLFRSYADDLPLMQWLGEKIWPLEENLQSEDVYWGTQLAILEMIRSGTTTFADMYFFMDQVAQAVAETGIRACLSRGMIGVAPTRDEALKESKELVRNWHRQAEGRINVMLGPHAPYTCPPDYLDKVLEMAAELTVGIHIHLAETRDEVRDITKQYGKTPIRLMEEVGLFKFPVLAAHCVHLDEEEIEILKTHGVGVVHNPESNMKLASGIAPVSRMLEVGVKVGLGTDGPASNNNLDLIEEMRTAALLQKVSMQDPTAIPAYQALEMATRLGAAALGLSEEVGVIKPGYKADIILVDLNQPHFYPHHDPLAHLVYAARGADVDTVIIDGKVVMENREVKTIDTERVYWEVEQSARRLAGR